MIMGWMENGRRDRLVLLDIKYPNPALHDARAVLREWATRQDLARARDRTPGPVRMPAACKSAVKTSGSIELAVWPCEAHGTPRHWTERDGVWRPVLAELADWMTATVACEVNLTWMAGGDRIVRACTEAGLAGMGFLGWKRGEKAPRNESPPAPPGEITFKVSGANLGVMPQGEKAWH